MDGAFGWISAIVEWLGKWIPKLEIIRTTYGAVKFRRGSEVIVLGPGLHFYWPLITDFVTFPTARQTDELRAQTITLADGKTIVISGLLVYEVVDLEKLIAHTHEPVEAIQDMALTSIIDVCCLLTWTELQNEQREGKLWRALRREAKDALEPYGVKVLKVTLTDLALAKVIRLVQSNSAGGV